MKIQIEDTVYEGTAAGIMEQLRDLSFDPTEFPDVELSLIHISEPTRRS